MLKNSYWKETDQAVRKQHGGYSHQKGCKFPVGVCSLLRRYTAASFFRNNQTGNDVREACSPLEAITGA